MSERGSIIWFDVHRRQGRIQPDTAVSYDRSGERKDTSVFIHANDLKKSGLRKVQPGDRVEFDIVAGHRQGETKAANIRLVA
jgi:cold shock CspA family protein